MGNLEQRPKVGEGIGRSAMKNRFEDDDGFAEAGIQVIAEQVEGGPGGIGLGGSAVGDIAGGFFKFAGEGMSDAGERGDLMQEARTRAEEDAVADGMPFGGAASGL